ncbi:hypothetical protein [Sinorhizobium fredii]|uniref:hypothetical protein n=1 Tax=Rhizobium fredii TaxID=380 RepID=UPI0004ADD1B2|nr:hypothetical protein [Sinorhizobium fredii]
MSDALKKKMAAAIFDPGATEGYKGDRTLTEWQTDAVMRALDAIVERSSAEVVLAEAEPYLEVLHSILPKGDARSAVWRIIQNLRAVLASPAEVSADGR